MSDKTTTMTEAEVLMDVIFCSIASAISLYFIMLGVGFEMDLTSGSTWGPTGFPIGFPTLVFLLISCVALTIFFIYLHCLTHVSFLQALAASFALLLTNGLIYFFDVSFTGRSLIFLILIWLGFMMGPSVFSLIQLHMQRTGDSRSIKCLKCGYVNRRESNYCSKCGADLTDGTKVYAKK